MFLLLQEFLLRITESYKSFLFPVLASKIILGKQCVIFSTKQRFIPVKAKLLPIKVFIVFIFVIQ